MKLHPKSSWPKDRRDRRLIGRLLALPLLPVDLGAVKYGNIFSLDVAPDRNGKLRAIDVETLQAAGRMIGSSAGTR